MNIIVTGKLKGFWYEVYKSSLRFDLMHDEHRLLKFFNVKWNLFMYSGHHKNVNFCQQNNINSNFVV